MDTTSPAHTDFQLPVLQGYAQEFYAFCKQGELRFQRCAHCKTWRHPPRPMCGQCQSFDTEWVAVKGQGSLYSWTVPMLPIGKVWGSYMPYVAAIVELDEGPRMATWVTGIAPADLRLGQRLQVYFSDLTPEVTRALFKPAD